MTTSQPLGGHGGVRRHHPRIDALLTAAQRERPALSIPAAHLLERRLVIPGRYTAAATDMAGAAHSDWVHGIPSQVVMRASRPVSGLAITQISPERRFVRTQDLTPSITDAASLTVPEQRGSLAGARGPLQA
jgi:hypothetical protein